MKYYCLKWQKELLEINYGKPLVDSSHQIELAQKELWRLFREEEDVIKKKKILDSILSAAAKNLAIKSRSIMSGHADEVLRELEKEALKNLDNSDY